ncbi:hypothetical protein POM88_045191 [Heracleum sosnowskyi]|uniref:Uncharacterized protein n=1 Tax=Heracleum sosnowskyi TaxID=360622 RepID=A0AAD8H6Y7_9APIA|nr:hypothetical protein POM88_045191 [Heracleum sosnowskyi]
MATQKFDSISYLKPGRYDYKIKARVIRKWRDTKIEDMEDNGTTIPQDTFDFYDHSELKNLLNQKTYLTDVIGIIKKYVFNEVKNKRGQIQPQAKFTITDGSSNVRVTFWDKLAAKLQQEITNINQTLVIIIISSARVGLWNEELEISNVSPTNFYINYKHHTVIQLRKKLTEPTFAETALTLKEKKGLELLTVDQILKLGKDYIETQVFAHVNIKDVDESNKWYIQVCTTCDNETEWKNVVFICNNCPRIVPHPETKYKINVVAQDPTGVLDIILGDREVRTIVGARARDVLKEHGNTDDYPDLLTNIAQKKYTVKLRIREINVDPHFQVYWASNICKGWVIPKQERMTNTEGMPQSSSQLSELLPPPNCIDQSTYPDYYFRVTNSENKTQLKEKFKRTCEKSMVSTRYMHLTEEILKENPSLCEHMAPSLDARQDIGLTEVPKLGKEAAAKAIEEWGHRTTKALFGDGAGAGAVIVGSDPVVGVEKPEVPGLISKNIKKSLVEAFESLSVTDWNSIFWVAHPGGPAILDQIETELKPNKLKSSRQVLKDYGNMSSACVLFILDEMRKGSAKDGKRTTEEGLDWGVLFGFGPGLTVETLVLHSVPT